MKSIWNNHKGFSLIEVLVTIAIIAISIGVATFGLSIVYDSRTKAAAKNFETDLKTIRMESITYTDRQYYLQWKYDVNSGYSYEIRDFSTPTSVLKTVQLNKQVDVQIIKNNGAPQSLKDLLIPALIPTQIMFEKNGAVSAFDLSSTDYYGDGTYIIKRDSASTKSYSITISKKTGGIFFDE